MKSRFQVPTHGNNGEYMTAVGMTASKMSVKDTNAKFEELKRKQKNKK